MQRPSSSQPAATAVPGLLDCVLVLDVPSGRRASGVLPALQAARGPAPAATSRWAHLRGASQLSASLHCERRPLPVAAAAGQSATAAAIPDGSAEWQQCRALLEGLGLNAERVDGVLTRAFGWGQQGYWRQEKVQEMPSEQQLDSVLDFLEGLGVLPEQQVELIQVGRLHTACPAVHVSGAPGRGPRGHL